MADGRRILEESRELIHASRELIATCREARQAAIRATDRARAMRERSDDRTVRKPGDPITVNRS